METGILKYSLKGVVCAVTGAALLLFAFNLCAFMCPDPDKYLNLFAVLILATTSAACGIASSGCAKDGGNSGVVCAAISGAVYSALLIIVSIIIRGEGEADAKCLLLLLCAAVSTLSSLAVSALKAKAGRPSPGKLRKTIAAKYQH